jgi:hypothetical protein
VLDNTFGEDTFGPLSVPEIFDRSVAIIVRSAAPILLVGLVCGAIPSIAADIAVERLSDEQLFARVMIDLFGIAMNILNCPALVYVLKRSMDGEATTAWDAFAAGLRFARPTFSILFQLVVTSLVLLAILLLVIGIPIALATLVLGFPYPQARSYASFATFALWVIVGDYLSFAFFVAITVGISRTGSQRPSVRSARRYMTTPSQRKRTIGLVLGSTAPYIAVDVLSQFIPRTAFITDDAVAIASNLLLIVCTAYIAANAVLFERDARVRLEGLDLEMRVLALTDSRPSA